MDTPGFRGFGCFEVVDAVMDTPGLAGVLRHLLIAPLSRGTVLPPAKPHCYNGRQDGAPTS